MSDNCEIIEDGVEDASQSDGVNSGKEGNSSAATKKQSYIGERGILTTATIRNNRLAGCTLKSETEMKKSDHTVVSSKHFMLSIFNCFKKTELSEVLCSVIEEDCAVKTIDLTGCEAKNVKSQLEKTEAQGSGARKRYIK
eukprot:gene11856-2402_t